MSDARAVCTICGKLLRVGDIAWSYKVMEKAISLGNRLRNLGRRQVYECEACWEDR